MMVTSFGCCSVDDKEVLQSPKHWTSFKVQGKMREGEKDGDRGMVMEVKGVWNQGGMGMLSCVRAGI